jgi:cytochrome c
MKQREASMRTTFAARRSTLALLLLLIAGMLSSAIAAPSQRARGKRLYDRECAGCHEIGPGAISLSGGPKLNGIIGMPAGDEPGFSYSDANRKSGVIWSAKSFDAFLANPKATMPETSMIYPGLKSKADRDALYAYVSMFDAHGAMRPRVTR